jgi:hypothetical protein
MNLNLETVGILVGIVSGLIAIAAKVAKVGFARILGGIVLLCLLGGGVYFLINSGKWNLVLPDAGAGKTTSETGLSGLGANELKLANAARATGEWAPRPDGSLAPFEWTVFLDGPRDRLQEVLSVTYELHPTFHPSVVEVFANAGANFPLRGSGYDRFELKAVVRFKDQSRSPLTLVHWLRLPE